MDGTKISRAHMTSAFNTSLSNIESSCNCFLNSGNFFVLLPDSQVGSFELDGGLFARTIWWHILFMFQSFHVRKNLTYPLTTNWIVFIAITHNATEGSFGTFLSQSLNSTLPCHPSKNLLLYLILLLIANRLYLLPEKYLNIKIVLRYKPWNNYF